MDKNCSKFFNFVHFWISSLNSSMFITITTNNHFHKIHSNMAVTWYVNNQNVCIFLLIGTSLLKICIYVCMKRNESTFNTTSRQQDPLMSQNPMGMKPCVGNRAYVFLPPQTSLWRHQPEMKLKQQNPRFFCRFNFCPSSTLTFASELSLVFNMGLSITSFLERCKATCWVSQGLKRFCSGDAGAILLWFTSLDWELDPVYL